MGIRAADVVVVGGGVIGCAVAYQLRKRGIDVLVVERGAIGQEASSAATGLLAPIRPFAKRDDPYMALQLASLALFPEYVPELEARSGLSVEYEKTGTLRIVRPEQVNHLQAWLEDWKHTGFRMELLTGDVLRSQEPLLSVEKTSALYNADEPQLQAPLLTRAYARAASHMGATLIDGCEVTGFLSKGERVIGVETTLGKVACGHVVIAAGAWSACCGEWLNVSIPVRPVAGQSFALKQPASLRHIIFGQGIYLAPKHENVLFVGATHEDTGFNPRVTPRGIAQLSTDMISLVPSLSRIPVERTWVGLRPKTPDSRPILGAVHGWDNVSVATGHGGFGMLLSAITGVAIADFILTNQEPKIIHPFSLVRFGQQVPSIA